MGWLSDLWDSIVNFIRDKILAPAINWVISLIDKIAAELKIMRHQLIKDLAKWLENDFNFILAFIGAIVAAVFWPRIFLYLKDLAEKWGSSGIIQAIKDGVAKITDSMFWINVETLHLVLRTVWPDYTAMMGDFAQAVAGLADELGEGSGYILAYFTLQNAIAFNTGALLGMDPKATELESYSKIAEFTKKIDTRFRRYAYDPGLIYRDFLEEIVIPSATDQRDTQQLLVTEVREQHERNVEFDRIITNTEQAVDDFIEAMPDEIAAQIEKRWEPIKTWMEENYHDLVDKFLTITGELTAIMELRQSRIEQSNAYAMEKLADPFNAMLNYELANEAQQASLREHNLELLGEATTEEDMIDSDKIQAIIDKTFSRIMNLARSLPGPPILEYEPAGFASIPTGAAAVDDSWFIGEF